MEYIQDLQRQINNYIIPLISNEQLLYYINNIKQIFQDLDKNYIYNVKKIENVQRNDKFKNQIKFNTDDNDNNNDDSMKIGSFRDDDDSPVVIVNDDDNNNKKSDSKSNTNKINMKSMNEIQNDYSFKNENINQNNNINKNNKNIPNKQQNIDNNNNYNDDSSSDNRIIQNLNMNTVSIEELRTKYLSNDIYNNDNNNKVNKLKIINNVKSNERLNEKILSLKSSNYNVITNYDDDDDDYEHNYTADGIIKKISENVVEDIMEVSNVDNAWYAFKKSMSRSLYY